MTFVINLALLLLGTAGALAAFGGETWRRTDEPLKQRITRRGWFALTCLFATLALGITKEIRTNISSQDSAKRQQDLENNLARTTTELRDTRAKLLAVEPNLIAAMITATSGIRKESDFSTPAISGRASVVPISGRSKRPLELYGGDMIDYQIFCYGGSGRSARFAADTYYGSPKLVLKVGETIYPLRDNGRQMIIGAVGEKMPVLLENPYGLKNCHMKMLVESADRTREAEKFEPLLLLIKEAKLAAQK